MVQVQVQQLPPKNSANFKFNILSKAIALTYFFRKRLVAMAMDQNRKEGCFQVREFVCIPHDKDQRTGLAKIAIWMLIRQISFGKMRPKSNFLWLKFFCFSTITKIK